MSHLVGSSSLYLQQFDKMFVPYFLEAYEGRDKTKDVENRENKWKEWKFKYAVWAPMQLVPVTESSNDENRAKSMRQSGYWKAASEDIGTLALKFWWLCRLPALLLSFYSVFLHICTLISK